MHTAEFSRTVALARDEGRSSRSRDGDPARHRARDLSRLSRRRSGRAEDFSRLSLWPDSPGACFLLGGNQQRPKEDTQTDLGVRRPSTIFWARRAPETTKPP